MKYKKSVNVSASMTNDQAKLSLIGAFQLVEDSLTEFMGALKIDGLTIKAKYSSIWVFTKNKIVINEYPSWQDKLDIECFILDKQLVKMHLLVVIKNNDKVLICSKVELCALDLLNGRIRKIKSVGVDDSILCEETSFNIDYDNNYASELDLIDQVKVKSTSIDFCLHTNNIEYIRFIMNTYSNAYLRDNFLNSIEVNYMSQSFENDELEIYKYHEEKKDNFLIKTDNDCIIRCIINFR